MRINVISPQSKNDRPESNKKDRLLILFSLIDYSSSKFTCFIPKRLRELFPAFFLSKLRSSLKEIFRYLYTPSGRLMDFHWLSKFHVHCSSVNMGELFGVRIKCPTLKLLLILTAAPVVDRV